MGEESRLKRTLREGRVARGIEHFIASRPLVEVAANLGFDFNLIDMHQCNTSFEQLEVMVGASQAGGITSLVRVREFNPYLINLALNTGADGVVVPDVNTAGLAREVVAAVKYPPVGKRLACPSIRAAKYGLVPWAEYQKQAQESIMSCVLVESAEGVENLAEIAAVPGLDILWLAGWDLSISLGVPGANFNDPKMKRCLRKASAECRHNHIPLFVTTAVHTSADYFDMLVGEGVNMICVFTDIGLFSRACKRVLEGQGI